jgi:hypothetical protein
MPRFEQLCHRSNRGKYSQFLLRDSVAGASYAPAAGHRDALAYVLQQELASLQA